MTNATPLQVSNGQYLRTHGFLKALVTAPDTVFLQIPAETMAITKYDEYVKAPTDKVLGTAIITISRPGHFDAKKVLAAAMWTPVELFRNLSAEQRSCYMYNARLQAFAWRNSKNVYLLKTNCGNITGVNNEAFINFNDISPVLAMAAKEVAQNYAPDAATDAVADWTQYENASVVLLGKAIGPIKASIITSEFNLGSGYSLAGVALTDLVDSVAIAVLSEFKDIERIEQLLNANWVKPLNLGEVGIYDTFGGVSIVRGPDNYHALINGSVAKELLRILEVTPTDVLASLIKLVAESKRQEQDPDGMRTWHERTQAVEITPNGLITAPTPGETPVSHMTPHMFNQVEVEIFGLNEQIVLDMHSRGIFMLESDADEWDAILGLEPHEFLSTTTLAELGDYATGRTNLLVRYQNLGLLYDLVNRVVHFGDFNLIADMLTHCGVELEQLDETVLVPTPKEYVKNEHPVPVEGADERTRQSQTPEGRKTTLDGWMPADYFDYNQSTIEAFVTKDQFMLDSGNFTMSKLNCHGIWEVVLGFEQGEKLCGTAGNEIPNADRMVNYILLTAERGHFYDLQRGLVHVNDRAEFEEMLENLGVELVPVALPLNGKRQIAEGLSEQFAGRPFGDIGGSTMTPTAISSEVFAGKSLDIYALQGTISIDGAKRVIYINGRGSHINSDSANAALFTTTLTEFAKVPAFPAKLVPAFIVDCGGKLYYYDIAAGLVFRHDGKLSEFLVGSNATAQHILSHQPTVVAEDFAWGKAFGQFGRQGERPNLDTLRSNIFLSRALDVHQYLGTVSIDPHMNTLTINGRQRMLNPVTDTVMLTTRTELNCIDLPESASSAIVSVVDGTYLYDLTKNLVVFTTLPISFLTTVFGLVIQSTSQTNPFLQPFGQHHSYGQIAPSYAPGFPTPFGHSPAGNPHFFGMGVPGYNPTLQQSATLGWNPLVDEDEDEEITGDEIVKMIAMSDELTNHDIKNILAVLITKL